jgi:hypothetical protein
MPLGQMFVIPSCEYVVNTDYLVHYFSGHMMSCVNLKSTYLDELSHTSRRWVYLIMRLRLMRNCNNVLDQIVKFFAMISSGRLPGPIDALLI